MSDTIVWYRGETLEYLIAATTTDPDNPSNPPSPLSLDNLTSLDLRVKALPSDADPPLAIIGLGTGITVRTQTGGNVGKADVESLATWIDSVTAGSYYFDVRAEWNDGTVRLLVKPTKVKIKDQV